MPVAWSFAYGRGGLVDDLVPGRPPRGEREVEPLEAELEAGDLPGEDAQGFLEELLPGLVPLEHHDRLRLPHLPLRRRLGGADHKGRAGFAGAAVQRTVMVPESVCLPQTGLG